MNLNPDSSAPVPEPTPAPQPPLVQPSAEIPSAPVSLKPPVKLSPPAAGGLRPPVQSAPAATPVVPGTNKLPERPRFVSPMPSIEKVDDSIPMFLPILAGIAAAVSVVFAVLLYLKH